MPSGVLSGQLCEVWGNFVLQRSPQWKGIFGNFSRLFLFGSACTVQYLPWNGRVEVAAVAVAVAVVVAAVAVAVEITSAAVLSSWKERRQLYNA